METKLLLPHKCKAIGFIIVVVGIAMFIFSDTFRSWLSVDLSWWPLSSGFMTKGKTDMTLTVSTALMIIGGMLIAFSKEKIEDEFISKLRLSSMLWAIFINYILLLLGVLLVYGIDFLNILFYNMFTPLIIFIVRFNFFYFKYSRGNEK